MKAVEYTRYGTPDVLELVDRPQPVPRKGELLIRVKAASINSWDWDMIRGEPWFVRMWGLFKPKFSIPGADIAGIVEAVGGGVTRFEPGDEVLGDLSECGWGGFAEYAVVPEKSLTLKPNEMSFEAASCLPQAGAMALQSIRDKGKLQPGQSLLINGAGGGVGTLGVQLAKMYGAEVTAVDSGIKHAMLTSLGADHVVDYARHDYTRLGRQYDLIIDVVADKGLATYKRVLKPKGQFIMIGGSPGAIVQAMALGRWASRNGGKTVGILPYQANHGVADLATLCKEGKLRPVIDRTFALAECRDAFNYYATGAVKGKVVITV